MLREDNELTISSTNTTKERNNIHTTQDWIDKATNTVTFYTYFRQI